MIRDSDQTKPALRIGRNEIVWRHAGVASIVRRFRRMDVEVYSVVATCSAITGQRLYQLYDLFIFQCVILQRICAAYLFGGKSGEGGTRTRTPKGT